MRGGIIVLTLHRHAHRHGNSGSVHLHWHDHDAATAHPVTSDLTASPPRHAHNHKTTARTALLLILGSSPMVEGIPAFFAAGKFGIGVLAAMALVFSAGTIVTYVLLCVCSTAGLQRMRFGAFERYGEVLSGAFISMVGVAFWLWPVSSIRRSNAFLPRRIEHFGLGGPSRSVISGRCGLLRGVAPPLRFSKHSALSRH